jgi:hypothetical protein
MLLAIAGVSLSDIDGLVEVHLFAQDATVTPDFIFGDAATVNQALAQLSLTPDEDYSGSIDL